MKRNRRRDLAVTVCVIAASAVSVGCPHIEADSLPVRLHDEGTVCLGLDVAGADSGTTFGIDITADQVLAVGVRTGCLSNQCATKRSASCTVKREGERLVVTSDMSWTAPSDIKRCNEDCSALEAKCNTEKLPAGSYKVVLGGQSVDVTVPSHRETRCVGDVPTKAAFDAGLTAPAVADAGIPRVATSAQTVDPSDVPAAPGTGVAPEPPPRDVLCFGPTSALKGRTIKAGQPIAITVFKKNPCVGASCAAAPPKCTAKRKGARIILDAQFPGPNTKPRKPCSDDCPGMAATCKTDNLPAGTYTIEHGLQRDTVIVPSTAPPCGQ